MTKVGVGDHAEATLALRAALREGAGGRPPGALREQLGLPTSATDRDAAEALVAQLSEADLAALTTHDRASQTDPRGIPLTEPVHSGDASFLGQLGASGQQAARELSHTSDLSTLAAVLRAGSLFQRRAAGQQLAQRVDNLRILPAEEQRELGRALEGVRDVELTYELRRCREGMPGAIGKEARAVHKAVLELAARVEADVRAYWEGSRPREPLCALSGDDRAQLLIYCRDLSDVLAAHVCALLEDEPASDPGARRVMVAAVRYCGDPRLVPALVDLLETGDSDLVIDAARALSRIEDPRVWPALLAAYERSVVDVERIALGAALGRVGDVRAAEYVRERLRGEDEHIFMRALEALRTTGEPEDAELVLPLLRATDPLLVTKAAHTLGRIADGRALGELRRTVGDSAIGAVRAAAEEAVEQVRARLVLRGEEPPETGETDSVEIEVAARSAGGDESPQDALVVRLAALRHYVIGRLWQLVGARRRALRRFERASTVRPHWTLPLLVAAMLHAARDEVPQALAAFRRALDLDRARVERNPLAIRALARCFLKRSEQVERDGRAAIARGLLDEVMSLDLRRVPSSLRFEIGRRHEALRLSEASR